MLSESRLPVLLQAWFEISTPLPQNRGLRTFFCLVADSAYQAIVLRQEHFGSHSTVGLVILSTGREGVHLQLTVTWQLLWPQELASQLPRLGIGLVPQKMPRE